MGLTCPPRPPTKEEVDAKVAAGAKTMAEIDPSFDKWLRDGARARLNVIMIGSICIITILTIAVVSIVSKETNNETGRNSRGNDQVYRR